MVFLAFSSMKHIHSEPGFSFSHFQTIFSTTYGKAFWLSMKLAALATFGALLLGYPIAYIISNSKFKNKYLLLLVFILPMWTNLLLRVEIINTIIKPQGFIKNMFGVSLNLGGSQAAVVIAMIIIYLPFMIFPIYTVLEKMDKGLLEASMDLGATPAQSFMKITIPLSLKGVMSGITMVFLPCAMGFTIPAIISEGNIYLIGNMIEAKFKGSNSEINVGSLASLIIIIFVFASLWLIGKIDEEGETLL